MSLPAALRLCAEDKVQPFKAGAASSYAANQKLEDVAIGIQAFDTADLCKQAFGKLNPNQHEVLPVLVVIENHRKNALRLDRLQIEYVIPGVGRVENTTLDELRGVVGPSRPNTAGRTIPIPGRGKVKKNPLITSEVERNSWSARMLAPGETASGFFYFQARHRTSARIYLTGLFEPATGKELFYYEIPFAP